MNLRERIAPLIKGDVADDPETLKQHSRDTSIFEKMPALVVFPKDTDDVMVLVRFAAEARQNGENLSLTARAAGTDMSGGPLTESIVVSFSKYMNRMLKIGDDYAVAEMGMYYRDFEKQTLAKNGMLLPSYPASRELCALGGIVNNNSAGELTLKYGKTERYVRALDVVLSDGTRTTFKPLSAEELAEKQKGVGLEAQIYRDIDELISRNEKEIEAARPRVTKNSAGYSLWNVRNKERDTFDLAQLVVGAQGTLCFVSNAELGLAKPKDKRAMLVVFLRDFNILPEVVRRVLEQQPESFESYDDHTFQLAIKLLPQLLAQMGIAQAIRLGFSFLPEVGLVLRGGVPKLVLMAEFSEDTQEEALHRAEEALKALADLKVETRIARDKQAAEKYWVVRRQAFAILRKKLPGLTAAPFIDDFVVLPETYPEFLPKLFALLDAEGFIYAVTGHIGDGNFHIFPLVDLAKPESHAMILALSPKVYALVKEYGGSTTGEHNDGIIRTPYLNDMFTPTMLKIFAEVKQIFDPLNIFNPGKKVGGTEADIEKYMLNGR